jgi:hypothetical protein
MSGLFTAAAVASLVGTGASAYANNQNLRKQDNQAAASIIKEGALNSQAGADVAKTNAAIAKSNPDNTQKQQNAAYLAALQQAQPTQAGVNPGVKGASKRYNQATANSQQDVNDYARSTASNLASTAAPQLQRINEGNVIANTASKLGLLNDTANAQGGLLKTQLAGDQADPWLSSIGTLLQGAGQGASSYAGYKSGKKQTGSNPYLG